MRMELTRHPGLSEEVFRSPNSTSNPTPSKIRIEDYTGSEVLKPGGYFKLPIVYHADRVDDGNICLMFVYRLVRTHLAESRNSNRPPTMKDDGEFRSTRASLPVQVQPAFEISMSSKPGRGGDAAFLLGFDVENTTPSTSVKISQISTMSPSWTCHSPTDGYMWVFHRFGDLKLAADAVISSGDLPPSQTARVAFDVRRWEGGVEGIEGTRKYVRRKIGAVLRGEEIDPSEPPPLEVSCTHFSGVGCFLTGVIPSLTEGLPQSNPAIAFYSEDISDLVRQNKRRLVRRSLSRTYPAIPSSSYHTVFPLYNPASLDVLVFWEIPTQGRRGHVLVSGLTLGAEHGDLGGIIEEAESAKVKRSMYAETQREKVEVMRAVRGGEWNVNSNPVVVNVECELVVEHDFESG